MTKMIFIPPFAMLDKTTDSYRHLMLPHLLTNDVYSNHFKRVKSLGHYIILDNGAAEGVDVPPNVLINIAYQFRVDELVIPDVMGDADSTHDKSLEFIHSYRNRLPVSTRLGYVLQGRTPAEVKNTYHRVVENARLASRVNVWYLPRLLVTEMYPNARIDVAEYILERDGAMRRPIHFLGANPNYINEVIQCRDRLGGRVRSMDTSAPFVYALANKFIGDLSIVSRNQEKYFTSLVTSEVRALAHRNCDVMNGWVGAKASASEL